MARVKLGLNRPNLGLGLTKNDLLLHSSSDQNLGEMINVAEKDQAAMVATAVNTNQTMVPSSCCSSFSSSSLDGDDDAKQNHDHDLFHQHIIKSRESAVNYIASQPCKSKKQLVQMRHASNPDHGHTSDQANPDYNRIGYDDQPRMKQEPVIIHARDPRVIHTDPGNFMLLVQSLTGSCTTRAAMCEQLEDQKQRKRKRNDYTCSSASTDEVQHETVDGVTVNDGLQQQKVETKQQQHQKNKKQKKNDKKMSTKRPAHEQLIAADHPIQSPHLPAHVTHESPSSFMDSHHKFAESPSLETDNLSSSPSHRLQDEGSMVSSPNISINYDTSGTPFSKSWNILTDSINSSPVMLPSFHGDQHDAAWTTVPWNSESIIDSLADSYVKNIVCWPVDEDDVAVNDDGDLCFNHGFQLASAKNEGFNMEDRYGDYIHESSFRIPPTIDFNVSSLCRSMPEISDIDSLFAYAADQIVQ